MTNNTFSKVAGLIALVFTLTVASSGHADMFFPYSTKPSTVGPIRVVLNDQAKDACWTNLRESREYAEEKLRAKGHTHTEDTDRSIFQFEIQVAAYRASNGACRYSLVIALEKILEVEGFAGLYQIGQKSTFGTEPDNANNVVIESIQIMIGMMLSD